MRTLLLIFVCKRPKCEDKGGGGQKTVKLYGLPLRMAHDVFLLYTLLLLPCIDYYYSMNPRSPAFSGRAECNLTSY